MTDDDNEQTVIFSNIKQVLAKTDEEAKEKDACLLAIGGELNGTLFDLPPGITTFGRGSDTTHRLEFEGVSRHHFLIRLDLDPDVATISDMGSSNGTYLNNQKLESSEILKKGDVIKMGILAFQYIPHGDPERLTYDKLAMDANTDGLTKCYNKTYFNQATDTAVKKARVTKFPLSLIVFDIDFFKKVNDQFGHDGGDYVLQEMAELIRRDGVREGDVYARYGGEEFVILLPKTDLEHSYSIAERVRQLIEDYEFKYDEKRLPVTVSVGVAEVREDVKSGKDLFKLADQGVYVSKEKGRNQVNAVQMKTQ